MVIASATGVATMGRGDRPDNHERGPSRSATTLKAMKLAVQNCNKQGITDPTKIKASILEARKKAKETLNG